MTLNNVVYVVYILQRGARAVLRLLRDLWALALGAAPGGPVLPGQAHYTVRAPETAKTHLQPSTIFTEAEFTVRTSDFGCMRREEQAGRPTTAGTPPRNWGCFNVLPTSGPFK